MENKMELIRMRSSFLIIALFFFRSRFRLWSEYPITFGGMGRCRRVEVARVFALVVRCRIMMVISLFSRWQKPWHQEGVPRRCRGQPVAPATNYSSLVTLLSRRGRQWPIPPC